MKQNILAEITYDGTLFYGWQRQKADIPTVQKTLEEALFKLFGQSVKTYASGRTDRGVHAYRQVVNFFIPRSLPLVNIKKALNSFLPAAVRIIKVKKAGYDFHARFSAHNKTYRYIILNSARPDVFWRNYAWFIPQKLDVAGMAEAAQILKGERDFSSFVKGASRKDCRRKVYNVKVKKRGRFVYIDIEANGFLYGMARAMVRALVDVGQRKLSLLGLRKAIAARQRKFIGKDAPACGLYLMKVDYNG